MQPRRVGEQPLTLHCSSAQLRHRLGTMEPQAAMPHQPQVPHPPLHTSIPRQPLLPNGLHPRPRRPSHRAMRNNGHHPPRAQAQDQHQGPHTALAPPLRAFVQPPLPQVEGDGPHWLVQHAHGPRRHSAALLPAIRGRRYARGDATSPRRQQLQLGHRRPSIPRPLSTTVQATAMAAGHVQALGLLRE